jgi:hypothetical protein
VACRQQLTAIVKQPVMTINKTNASLPEVDRLNVNMQQFDSLKQYVRMHDILYR